MNGAASANSGGQSDIFTETIPKYGKVAMLFYIPPSVKDRDSIIEVIKQNGGNIVEFQEWFTYQLGPPDDFAAHRYYPAEVYSSDWVTESAKAGYLIEKTNYLLTQRGAGIKFPFDKKKIQYTIREVIIIYNWISGRKSQASRKTWESLGAEGILYCRSRESLKNFWKNWRKYPVDECVEKLIESETRYSHNYSKPIYPHEDLPESKPKNKLKRSKEQLAAQILQENDPEDPKGPEESGSKKRMVKRKLKKRELDVASSSNRESAGVGQNDYASNVSQSLEIRPIMQCEQIEESEVPNLMEDEKESVGDQIQVSP